MFYHGQLRICGRRPDIDLAEEPRREAVPNECLKRIVAETVMLKGVEWRRGHSSANYR